VPGGRRLVLAVERESRPAAGRGAKGPKPLLAEVGALRFLLNRFLDDKRFLSEHTDARIIYFVDSHELVSFIKPEDDEQLRGFGFDTERTGDDDPATARDELKLKNEQILRKLLFNGSDQVGLLPSHGEEVDEEYLYHQIAWARQRIRLLQTALRQLVNLRDHDLADKFLTEASRRRGLLPETKRQLLDVVREMAPALMTLLSPRLSSPKARIDALINDSTLVGLDDYDWSRVGISDVQAASLRQLRPSRLAIDEWRDYLEGRAERQHNSSRANRIDAEALATLELLNSRLAEMTSGRVCARLVTRAMTLINASRDETATRRAGLRAADFIRHPRMLMFPASTEPELSDDLIRTLVVSLEAFELQLKAQKPAGAPLHEAKESFRNAWRNFEQARLALGLRADVACRGDSADLVNDDTLRQMIEWFVSDLEVEKLIHEQVKAALQTFGLDTFTLGKSGSSPPLAARIVQLESPRRASVQVIGAGVQSPVEFACAELRDWPTRIDDLEEKLRNLHSKTGERYLAWSLLHACRCRWKLAEIYAQIVLEIDRIMPRESSAGMVHEARLQVAQVRRLGVLTTDPDEQEPTGSHRVESTLHLLTDTKRSDDPRVAYETAAHILESFLTNRAELDSIPRLSEGLRILTHALECTADRLMRVRILELLVTYAIAARRLSSIWPAEIGEITASGKAWHEALHAILVLHRDECDVEEMPHRARAAEIIGFMFENERGNRDWTERMTPLARLLEHRDTDTVMIPFELKNFAGKLYKQLDPCADRVSRLLADELRSITRRLERYREPDLIYAPLWSESVINRFIETMPTEDLKQLSREGFRILALLGGPQQRGIEESDGPPLLEAATAFESLAGHLPDAVGDPPDYPQFICGMEACYARLLYALIPKPESDRRRELNVLAEQYAVIGLLHPRSSVPHFRRSIVLDSLGLEPEARAELDRAAELVDADPYLKATPFHWIRSTIRRRRASYVLDDARMAREAFVEHPDRPELLTRYLGLLRDAFIGVFTGFDPDTCPSGEGFAAIEWRRRINNIVFYSALYLEADQDLTELHPLGYNRSVMRRLAARLYAPGTIKDVAERYIAHTIGYAYWVLGETVLAQEAGERLVSLLLDSDRSLPDTEVASYMKDVRRWRQIRVVDTHPGYAN
jgi:hypothetical protein